MLLQPFQSYKAMHSRADDRPWKGNQQRGAATSAAIPAADVPIRIHGHPVTTSARRWAQRGRLVDESAPAAAAASNGGRRDARSGLDTYPMSPTVDDELHKYPTLLGVLRAGGQSVQLEEHGGVLMSLPVQRSTPETSPRRRRRRPMRW